MPFFLVTQTSLVEAQDKHEAAEIGVDRLRSGREVTVTVKSDETTITNIVVAALVEEPIAVSTDNATNLLSAAIPEVALAAPANRILILKRMMADGLALLGRRT